MNYDLQSTLEFVLVQHRGGFRNAKAGELALPYGVHPFDAFKLAYDFGVRDLATLRGIAGHDLFEETDVARRLVEDCLGKESFDIIIDLTHKPFKDRLDVNWFPQYSSKEAYLKALSEKGIKSLFTKIVDRFVNVQDFLVTNPAYARKYFFKANVIFDAWRDRMDEAMKVFGIGCVKAVNEHIIELLHRIGERE